MEKNRERAFVRLRFRSGLKSELRLMDNGGNLLSEAQAPVIVLDMSPDGLSFMSGLKLPVKQSYLIDFRFRIGDVSLQVRGHLVSGNRVENHFEYGVRFYPPYKLRPVLIRLLNQEMLRQNPNEHRIHRLYRRLNSDYSGYNQQL